jgi:hypothetical protein
MAKTDAMVDGYGHDGWCITHAHAIHHRPQTVPYNLPLDLINSFDDIDRYWAAIIIIMNLIYKISLRNILDCTIQQCRLASNFTYYPTESATFGGYPANNSLNQKIYIYYFQIKKSGWISVKP